MNFADLGLSDELLKAVTEAGYDTPTPIQAQAIPPVLMMKDIIGIAQTGTGKTASFVLPMIDILAHGRSRARMPRSLILEPTRELAAQVAENFEKYGKYHKLSMALLIGGVSMGDQLAALEKGVDVLIATPGRLMDLFGRGKIMLNGCSLLVIDEADRMLDMGFIPDIEEICTKLPAQRQTLLFSATMPPVIKKLADKFLTNPKSIEVARPATASINIAQWLVQVESRKKRDVLHKMLQAEDVTNAIIFCNRKTTVRDLNKSLQRSGMRSSEIHGDMDQGSRIAELDRFKRGEVNILVASDVAARGLDIKGVSHVFNFDAPWHPDDYVHRIGRTGRAGATGVAYTFVTPEDAEAIDNIQKLIGTKINKVGAEKSGSEKAESPPATATDDAPAPTKRARSGRGRKKPSDDGALAETAPMAEKIVEQTAEIPVAAPRYPPASAPRSDVRAEAPAPTPVPPRPEARPEPRQQRADPAPRPSRGRDHHQDDGPDDGWNGPMPDFLSFGFGTGPA
ncbi:DEAD/DEAH box helicase [soil metagenome]